MRPSVQNTAQSQPRAERPTAAPAQQQGVQEDAQHRWLGHHNKRKRHWIAQAVWGWIGLEVEQDKFTAIVTGYAFEDTGGDIYTGQTPDPSALALLAMGATGIAALRRRRNVQAIDV